jgi:hypothetical protein
MAALFYDRRGAVLPRRGMDMSSAFKEPAGDETLCSVFFAGKYAGAVLRSGKREFAAVDSADRHIGTFTSQRLAAAAIAAAMQIALANDGEEVFGEASPV